MVTSKTDTILADMGGVTGEIVVVVDVHGIHLVVTTSKNGTYRV